jgi:hypothetical protein
MAMIKVLTGDQMKNVDKKAIEDLRVPGLILMENAGRAVFEQILDILDETEIENPNILVICGKGNNGGDGFVTARHLVQNGIQVKVVSLYEESDLSGDALINHNVMKNFGEIIYFEEIDLDFMRSLISESDIIVRNSMVTNCSAYQAYAFFYQNLSWPDYRLEISNSLFAHNTMERPGAWALSLFWFNNKLNRTQVNNCTFAHNENWGNSSLRIMNNADIRNCIFYNPGLVYEVMLSPSTEPLVPFHPVISNSLFGNPIYIGGTGEQHDLLLNTNPLFAGADNDSLSLSNPEYYKLSANSPCINTGVADTTGLHIPPMDLAGNYRVWDGQIDMGCYEFNAPPYVGINDPENLLPMPQVHISSYPNPVYLNSKRAHAVFLEFALPEKPARPPVIEIFNIKGQKVKTMEVTNSLNDLRKLTKNSTGYDTKQTPYSTVWNLRNEQNREIGSGVYIIKLKAGKYQSANKMMVIR